MSSSHLLRPPRNFGVHLLLLVGQEKKGDDVTKHVIVRPAARCVFSTTALWPQSGPEAVFLLHFGGDEVVPPCGGGHSIEKHLAVFAKKIVIHTYKHAQKSPSLILLALVGIFLCPNFSF